MKGVWPMILDAKRKLQVQEGIEPKAHFEQKFTMVLERFLIDMGSYLRHCVFHSMGRWIDISKRQYKILVLIVIGEHMLKDWSFGSYFFH